MKITRRALAFSALAGAAAAQTPAPQPAAAGDLDQARQRVDTASQKLREFDIPMSAEPAVTFKA